MANPRTIARLEAQILRRAAHCLQFELADPRAVFITLTGVELSRDLSRAELKYSVLGDAGDITKAQHLLEDASGFVQRQVARVLRIRSVPRMRWVYDESIAEAARLDRLIRDARERDHRIAGRSEDSDDPQEQESSEGLANQDHQPRAERKSDDDAGEHSLD